MRNTSDADPEALFDSLLAGVTIKWLKGKPEKVCQKWVVFRQVSEYV
jgi:hypothetical protein